MADERNSPGTEEPANNSRLPDVQEAEGKAEALGKLDAAARSIARLIGRQMARDDFEARISASDKRSRSAADDRTRHEEH